MKKMNNSLWCWSGCWSIVDKHRCIKSYSSDLVCTYFRLFLTFGRSNYKTIKQMRKPVMFRVLTCKSSETNTAVRSWNGFWLDVSHTNPQRLANSNRIAEPLRLLVDCVYFLGPYKCVGSEYVTGNRSYAHIIYKYIYISVETMF